MCALIVEFMHVVFFAIMQFLKSPSLAITLRKPCVSWVCCVGAGGRNIVSTKKVRNIATIASIVFIMAFLFSCIWQLFRRGSCVVVVVATTATNTESKILRMLLFTIISALS